MGNYDARIGVDIGDFRLPAKAALARAAELSFRVVELPVAVGDLSPTALSASGRRHLLRMTSGMGIGLASLSADHPGMCITDPTTVDQHIQQTRRAMELAADLNVPCVTADLGALTHPTAGDPLPMAVEALRRLGEHADATGVAYAVRPTGDDAERLAAVLDQIRCPSIAVCLDPAAAIMIGVDPEAFVMRFAGGIVLTHMRDATGGRGQSGHETRLGEGHVDLGGVLCALDASDYAGTHIIRRTDSERPAVDLAHGREVLERYLPPG